MGFVVTNIMFVVWKNIALFFGIKKIAELMLLRIPYQLLPFHARATINAEIDRLS